MGTQLVGVPGAKWGPLVYKSLQTLKTGSAEHYTELRPSGEGCVWLPRWHPAVLSSSPLLCPHVFRSETGLERSWPTSCWYRSCNQSSGPRVDPGVHPHRPPSRGSWVFLENMGSLSACDPQETPACPHCPPLSPSSHCTPALSSSPRGRSSCQAQRAGCSVAFGND